MGKSYSKTESVKKAESTVKPQDGLVPAVSAWQRLRRWLGIYTREEKEVLAYAKRIKQETILVASKQKQITSRPDWMRYEDYKKLRSLQNKVERKKHVKR